MSSNLYLFCSRPAPKDEDEMMVAIFEYIDRIFNIVRPRRLLYMAIDGVVSHKFEQHSHCISMYTLCSQARGI